MLDYDDLEDIPSPEGHLSLKLVALPKDANLHGDISAGWVEIGRASCRERV